EGEVAPCRGAGDRDVRRPLVAVVLERERDRRAPAESDLLWVDRCAEAQVNAVDRADGGRPGLPPGAARRRAEGRNRLLAGAVGVHLPARSAVTAALEGPEEQPVATRPPRRRVVQRA